MKLLTCEVYAYDENEFRMDDYENLSHSKWDRKYAAVFVPGSSKDAYGGLSQHLGAECKLRV